MFLLILGTTLFKFLSNNIGSFALMRMILFDLLLNGILFYQIL